MYYLLFKAFIIRTTYITFYALDTHLIYLKSIIINNHQKNLANSLKFIETFLIQKQKRKLIYTSSGLNKKNSVQTLKPVSVLLKFHHTHSAPGPPHICSFQTG